MRALGNERGSSLAVVLMATLLLGGLATALATVAHTADGSFRRGLDGTAARFTARAAFERACVDVLAGSSDWTTLGPGDESSGVSFGDQGDYDVSFTTTGHADSVHVEVEARVKGSTRTLVFITTRESDGADIDLREIQDHELERWLGERLATP